MSVFTLLLCLVNAIVGFYLLGSDLKREKIAKSRYEGFLKDLGL